jgi:hypothetical protein
VTTAVYAFWAGSRSAHEATGGFSWVFVALFVGDVEGWVRHRAITHRGRPRACRALQWW